ncbi:MAG TPA: glutamine-hydrolyzing GMP synthase [Candidatus Cloacimonadota bacterium]|nr:glutamine-hydrolyzing GMP synthase [Candidatus Cloacimonadota bacterium]
MKKIAIIDFGGQYTHLIARRVRNLGIYSEIFQPEDFKITDEMVGIIFSGGPQSVNAEDAYRIDIDIENVKIPILGICYGHQILAAMLGGTIESGENKEYGLTNISCESDAVLFAGLAKEQTVWMSHGDHVSVLPDSCRITAYSDAIKVASYESKDQRFFGVQFHPEVTHTVNGLKMLDRFLAVCTDKRDWKAENFKETLIEQIRQEAKGKKLVLLLSGGVDSLVALELCIQAVGNENVFSIHVDTGFMRKNESQEIMEHFKKLGFKNIRIIDAEELYLRELKGIVEPEAKRLIIGKLFVDIADQELTALQQDEELMLVQGTIYPDTIESGATDKAAKIKTHHNRVDEIQKLIAAGRIIEPIKELYKDEVRKLGEELGLPQKLVQRHPFPGPGLAIRVICSETDKLSDSEVNVDALIPAISHKERSREILTPLVPLDRGRCDKDEISTPSVPLDRGMETEEIELNEILAEFGLSGKILPIKSVGVQGDFRTYHHPAVVWFKEGIKPDWEAIKTSASKAINKLQSVNRVVFSLQPADLQLHKLFLEKPVMDKLREVDAVLREETDGIPEIWQMPVVALPLFQNENQAFVMRPVCSTDAMTASVYEMDFAEFGRLSRLIQRIHGVGILLYDVTTKPPGTIEWE